MVMLGGAVSYTELRDMPLPELNQLQATAAEVMNKLSSG